MTSTEELVIGIRAGTASERRERLLSVVGSQDPRRATDGPNNLLTGALGNIGCHARSRGRFHEGGEAVAPPYAVRATLVLEDAARAMITVIRSRPAACSSHVRRMRDALDGANDVPIRVASREYSHRSRFAVLCVNVRPREPDVPESKIEPQSSADMLARSGRR